MRSVTEMLSGNEGRRSVAARTRERRYELFLERFPDLPSMRVLDLGGEAHTWAVHDVRPASVVLLNLDWRAKEQQRELAGTPESGWIEAMGGDACQPPEEIRNDSFNLVYSNSVIEHVGGHMRRRLFAHYARQLADHHWIQTPNRYFPIEPHWLFPGFQFLPVRARGSLHRHWPIGSQAGRSDSREKAVGMVLDVELLSRSSMSYYFPESEILRERVAGLTKSLIAVR
jgi:hypothetical protein